MTLSEIASARLPGLPASAYGMAKRARAAGWERRAGMSRPRKAAGGGLEFSIELLPAEARAEIVRREGGNIEIDESTVAALTLRTDDSLSATERERRDARLHVLAMFDAFRREKGLTVRDARVLFSAGYTAGAMDTPEWVRNAISSLSWRTLESWRAILRDHGADALGLDRRGRPAILDKAADGKAKTVALAAIAKQEFLPAKDLGAYLQTRFEAELPSSLSVRTVQRARVQLEARNRNVLMKLRDPDGYRSKVEFAATNATFAAGLNDLWEFDASPADVMLKGKKRHSIYLAIDVWSRRTKITVTETPRADAVADLNRKCLLAWGVPNRIKTDQGSDFKAKATARLMTALGIEHEICDAYDPTSKGTVERAIGTFQHDLAICPGFIGHSVADRKKIENRKAFSRRLGMDEEQLFEVEMDLPEFQAWCDTWTDEIYGQRAHEGLRRSTPFLKAASWQGDVKRISQPEALNVLLAPIVGKNGIRTVTKKGIAIGREHYQTVAAWPGDEVFVRQDPTDLGRALVFSLDGETYLGDAICPPLAGLDPVEVAMRVKAAQKAHEKAGVAELRKEMRAIGPRDFMNATLGQARKKAATLTYLERPAAPYTTPAIEAAQEAVEASRPDVPAYTPEQRAQVSAAVVPMPTKRPAPQSTPEQRFRRAIEIEAQIERGEPVNMDDEVFLRGYRPSSEYKGWLRVFEQRGPGMFAG
ncbi:DNA-binding protein [Paenirhodobacter populi]|nr:DDE-type integrase/transposase/recombinase [Sinirhodobacter populi]